MSLRDTQVPLCGQLSAEDDAFLELASQERIYSDDPKAKFVARSAVGAVLVKEGHVIASSANVLPPPLARLFGANGSPLNDEERYFFIEHAERAVLQKALISGHIVKGSTLYGTRFPCADCARVLLWCGVSRAVFLTGFSKEKRWLSSQHAAMRMMKEGGILVCATTK